MEKFKTLDKALNDYQFCYNLDNLDLQYCYDSLSTPEARYDLFKALEDDNIDPLINVTKLPNTFLIGTPVQSIVIPDSITKIRDYAFSSCLSLTSVVIPDNVTRIGDYAFSGCKSLTSITIPDSVASIGWYAFYECSALTSVTIPNSIIRIGYGVFSGCEHLKDVTYKGTKDQWNSIDLDNFIIKDLTIHCTDGDIEL